MVISLIKERDDYGRIFSLGLGSSASRHLVKGIARAGKGTAMFARQDEDLRPKVTTQLKNALQPAMNDIEITWDGVSFNDGNIKKEKRTPVELETRKTLLGYMKPKKAEENVQKNTNDPKTNSRSVQIPSKAPPVFDGQRLLMYWDFGKFWDVSCLSKGDSGDSLMNPENCTPRKIEIVAESPDGPLKVELRIDESNIMEDGDFIKKLAARKKIQELEENQEFDEYGNVRNNLVADDRKQFIIKLGIENCLASSQTSFVGVDERTKKRINEGVMYERHINNQIPSGFAMSARRPKQFSGQSQCFSNAIQIQSGSAMSLGSMGCSNDMIQPCSAPVVQLKTPSFVQPQRIAIPAMGPPVRRPPVPFGFAMSGGIMHSSGPSMLCSNSSMVSAPFHFSDPSTVASQFSFGSTAAVPPQRAAGMGFGSNWDAAPPPPPPQTKSFCKSSNSGLHGLSRGKQLRQFVTTQGMFGLKFQY